MFFAFNKPVNGIMGAVITNITDSWDMFSDDRRNLFIGVIAGFAQAGILTLVALILNKLRKY